MENEQTLALIKPDVFSQANEIKTIIKNAGFQIIKEKNFKFTRELCSKFYEPHINKPFYNDLKDYMTSGQSCALILEKKNAISDWRD